MSYLRLMSSGIAQDSVWQSIYSLGATSSFSPKLILELVRMWPVVLYHSDCTAC